MAFVVVACHPRPIDDLALADVAIKAAGRAKADALAPDTYRKAENFFLRAKKDYSDGYFESCRKNSDEARKQAELAEFQALKKQNQIKAPGDFATPGVDAQPPPLEGN